VFSMCQYRVHGCGGNDSHSHECKNVLYVHVHTRTNTHTHTDTKFTCGFGSTKCMGLKMLGLQDFGDMPLPCAIQRHCIVKIEFQQEEEWRKRTRKRRGEVVLSGPRNRILFDHNQALSRSASRSPASQAFATQGHTTD
jgi:hypothetical protein